ncbi:hypothetical protein [Halorhodospira halophila]|nr:hypothetical protein [Halorhodospira halophila]
MNRLRRRLRALSSPGGLRRHPVLAAGLALIVVLLIIGLVLRPM